MHCQLHFQDHLMPNFPSSSTILDKLTTLHWETPKFSFNVPNQAKEWKSFYMRAFYFPEALVIDPDVEDQGKRGWCQIKMMFAGEDHQTLQTLTEKKPISPDAWQTVPWPLRPSSLWSKQMCIFGTIEISSCQIFANFQKKVYIASPIGLIPLLASASSPMRRSKK